MFCPQCRAEYRAGFVICAHCRKKLVRRLPPLETEPAPEYVAFSPLLATYNPGDIALVKSLLDGEGIVYFFQGEHFTYMRPLADPARLMVRTDQLPAAADILKDLDLSYVAINLEKHPPQPVCKLSRKKRKDRPK